MKKIYIMIIFIAILIGGIYITDSCFGEQFYVQKLITAIEKNDLKKLENLLKKEGNINAKPHIVCIDCSDFPPLHRACILGNFDAVKLLVENGANINNNNSTNNTTPLLAALDTNNSNRFEIAKYLIDNGADISYMDTRGFTALYLSVRNLYSKELFDFSVWLIKNGADVNNSYGNRNLIIYASESNNVHMVEYLLKNQLAEINYQTSSGYSALMLACMGNSIETVEYLLENGASKELKNENGETALDLAILYNRKEIMILLNK